jgi:formylglycine-generating enzyme required for sulfatase activity
LIVTIIAIVHYNEHRLPEQRAELYEKCVDVLLAEKHHQATEANYELADWGGTLAEKRQWLAYLAYCMMSAGEDAGRAVDETTLENWLLPRLARRLGEEKADAQMRVFTQAMRERGSLLAEREGLYQFTHLSFQEYLCASYLAESVREVDKIIDYLCQERRLAAAWWRETILLLAGYLGLKSEEQALILIAKLDQVQDDDALNLAASELAATAFLELEGHDEALKMTLVQHLVTLLSEADVDVPPALRALAGAALGRLGDPRPGVATLEPQLIPIPAGPFLMGDNLDENNIVEPFAIGRTPVTNAQFRLFWKDGGYGEKWRRCWTAAGWAWRERSSVTAPRFLEDPAYNLPNQPLTGVSWYEAVAYANWLAEQTERPYRLPTEAEWERAARHTDGRTYPWGEDWRDGIANTEEAGLGRPCAVGIFPSDRSEPGLMDLAGNVNEWCQTRWQDEEGQQYPHPYRSGDGREELGGGDNVGRVLKGGSFYNDKSDWPRCASRHRLSPYFWDYTRGFRLVVSPLL